MKSLLNRLSLAMAAVLLTAAALLAGTLQDFPRSLIEDYVLSRLRNDAVVLLLHVREAGADEDLEQILDQALGPDYQLPLSGHYFILRVANQPWQHSRSLWDSELGLEQQPFLRHGQTGEDNEIHFRHRGPDGHNLLVLARRFPASRDNPAVELYITQPLTLLDSAIRHFHLLLLPALLAALVVLLWLQRHLLRRGLAPLHSAVAACTRIERGEQTKVDQAHAPSEIRPMLDALNRLAEHSSLRLGRVRRALGNVSHALKTPLAILQQQAEHLRSSGQSELADTLEQQLNNMRHTIERELRRARLAGEARPEQGFDARSQLDALRQALLQLYADKNLDLEFEIPSGSFTLDREDMLELFGNLLDNACKWAQHRVSLKISLCRQPSRLDCLIDDDGPGASTELREQFGQRSVRADENRPGHGLGLLIVHDILQQYGGDIAYQPSPTLGGLRIALQLPLEGELPQQSGQDPSWSE